MFSVAPFALNDSAGQAIGFPGTRPSLVCVIKGDCPTCRVVMPVLALIISTIFEKLEWQIDLIIGLPILISGAILVINQNIKVN